MATKTAKPRAKKIIPVEFIITVKIDNAVYSGAGMTPLEALRSVPTPSNDLISTGTVTIEQGPKNRELLFPTMQLKRLLNPYHQEVLINDLMAGF